MTLQQHEYERQRQRAEVRNEFLDELRATRREIADLRRLFDEFCGVYLNAKFPYGKGTDRWSRR